MGFPCTQLTFLQAQEPHAASLDNVPLNQGLGKSLAHQSHQTAPSRLVLTEDGEGRKGERGQQSPGQRNCFSPN